MIKISVIIPVYNSKKYLSECIGSVISQSFKNLEIILVDDGSTDGSGAMCDEYALKYDFIRVFHQINGGASSARNHGLREAKGRFVHFIDSDDYLSNNRVYENISEKAFGENPDIVFFRRERIKEGVDGIDAVQPAYNIDGYFCGDVLKHILENQYILTMTCPVNKIFRRTFLVDNHLYFTEGLDHEEDEWLPRVIECSRRVWFDKGVYYTVRNHAGSLSNNSTEIKITDKACSKIKIAVTGIEYMESKKLMPDTMSLAADYYWDYLINACVVYNKIILKENRKRILAELSKSTGFFDSYRYLKSKNRRILGVMFRILGIKNTVKIIGLRYGK